MSGHNKWSKIKHKKAAGDAAKSRIFSKHAAIIAMESRNASGNLASPGLAALEEVMFEAFGPGGTAMIITAVTDNNNRTAPEIRHILSKAGYALGTPGSAAWAFTKVDTRYVPQNPVELSDADGEKLAELVETLEENEDVQDVFTTADEAGE